MVGGLGEGPLQHVPRVGDARGAVGQGAGRRTSGPCRALSPRQGSTWKVDGVGLGEHVGLVDAREALDDRAVEADALGEGALELGRRDRHRLQGAEHVGEPEPDEPDVALFDRAEHELLLTVHVSILPHRCFLRVTATCDPGTTSLSYAPGGTRRALGTSSRGPGRAHDRGSRSREADLHLQLVAAVRGLA